MLSFSRIDDPSTNSRLTTILQSAQKDPNFNIKTTRFKALEYYQACRDYERAISSMSAGEQMQAMQNM